MPTDTIPGLVCIAQDAKAVEKLFELKGRDLNKPPTVIISDISQLEELHLLKPNQNVVKKYWKEKISLVLAVDSSYIEQTAYLHRGKGSLAVRISSDKQLTSVIRKTGPLATTSANPQGMQPAYSSEEAKRYFGSNVDLYVSVQVSNRKPSTIVKIVNGNVKKIR